MPGKLCKYCVCGVLLMAVLPSQMEGSIFYILKLRRDKSLDNHCMFLYTDYRHKNREICEVGDFDD